MIKYKIDSKKKEFLPARVSGDLMTLSAEATLLIRDIYKNLRKDKGDVAADAFKQMIKIAVLGDDSPLWA